MTETWARTTFSYMHNTSHTPRQHGCLVLGVATFETTESTLACRSIKDDLHVVMYVEQVGALGELD